MSGGDGFFVGWRGPDRSQSRFLALVAAAVVAGAGLLGFAVAGGMGDASAGLYRLASVAGAAEAPPPEPWDFGATLRGRVTDRPYGLLHLPADAAHPHGRTVLLSGAGKTGAPVRAGEATVELSGGLLRRGTIEMLALFADPAPTEDAALPVPAPVPLGRWRAAGEICDGKCAAGAMRPGTGLSHRACANLCLSGGVPPVFAAAAPVAGSLFLLLADADGGPLPDGLFDLVALPVELEGDVERIGSLLVFKVDLAAARRL